MCSNTRHAGHARAQVTNFEFSNESYLSAYNGQANAYWYGWALAQWTPMLKQILPGLRMGANGEPYWNSVGGLDTAQNNIVYWWQQVRAQPTSTLPLSQTPSLPA